MMAEKPAKQMLLGNATKGDGSEAKNFYVLYNGEGILHLVHGGKANVTFADGHVELIGPEELRRFRDDLQEEPGNFGAAGFDPKVMDADGNIISAL